MCYTKSLVVDNLKLVHHFAKPYRMKHRLNDDEYQDLSQEGMLGLICAAQKYDASRNVAFSTYSSYWIRSYFTKYMRNYYRKTTISLDESLIHGSHEDHFPELNLNVLSLEDQFLIHLRYTRGKSYKGIGEILGMSQHQIMRRHRQILVHLIPQRMPINK